MGAAALLASGAAANEGEPIQFLNAKGLSTVQQANDYYAQVDPEKLFTGRRQCAVVEPGNPGVVTLSHGGLNIDYQPGLQLRLFSSSEKKETSQIRVIRSGSGNGRHVMEDPFAFLLAGACLDYEIVGSVPTFEDWLDRAFGVGQDGDFVGRSFNGRDLRFGRYTVGGVRGDDVYTYVQNFRSLRGANAWQGPRSSGASLVQPFATVAIEYSRTHGGTDPTLKYFIYDDRGVRIGKVDLDGTGDKHLPNVCAVCHSDNFIPIDLESQTFAEPFGRAVQEDAFRQLNQILLHSDPPDHLRQLIEGWYASGPTQDNDFVPTGWAHDPALYEELVEPNCRSCHITQGFDYFEDRELFQNLATFFAQKFCDDGSPMPNALVTYELFLGSSAPALFEQETGVPIPCLRDPDFEASFTQITPLSPEAGDLVTFEFVVSNIGVGDYDGGAPVRLTLRDPNGDTQVVDQPIASLASGESRTFTVQHQVDEPGFWRFDLAADPDGVVPEVPDEGGNTDSRIIEVTGEVPLPNLIMTPLTDAITYSPANPQAGQPVTFTIRVRNHGQAPTPAGQSVRVRLETPVGNVTRFCSPISPGGTCILSYTLTAATGTGQRFAAIVDRFNQIHESDETDNEREIFYNVSHQVACQGTWSLTGVGHAFNASGPGSVVGNCEVYWSSNQPVSGSCFETVGIDDIEVTWHRDGGQCPVRATAYRPRDGATFEYNVTIQ